MTSKLDICNLALQNIRQARIASLEEQSTEALEVDLRYDLSRDVTLQGAWWGFAKQVDSLALIDETPDEWLYSYTLPNECVAPRYIVPLEKGGKRIRFERARGKILTNHPDAKLAYTIRVTDPVQYPPAFIDAFSWRLAADIVLMLTGKRAERQDALQIFAEALAQAKRLDGNEDYHFEYTDHDASWVEDRN